MNTSRTANKLLAAGFSIIPVSMPSKKPAVKSWMRYQTRLPKPRELNYSGSLGLVCGKVSGGIEVIDIDTKNFEGNGDLYKSLIAAIKKTSPQLVKKFVIQRTISGGYHLIFRCKEAGRNQVLAKSIKGRTLIETRANGGYIVIAPTEGYAIMQGRFEKLRTITSKERAGLLEACKSFNFSRPAQALGKPNKQCLKSLEELDMYIDALGDRDITANYDDWLTIIFGIAHTFGEAGREAMHRLCSNYPGYSKQECNNKFSQCLKDRGRKEKVRTVASVFDLINSNLSQAKIKQLARKTNELKEANEVEEFKEWAKDHIYLIPSTMTVSKYSHVLVDNNNICYYFESLGSGRPSELLQQKIAEIRSENKWHKFENEGLRVFDEKWLQRDTATECYFYFQNGTVRITKNKTEFIPGSERPMIWNSLVLWRDYKPTDKVHSIADLAKKAAVDYEKLQIGIGYLLHRYWFRNATKIVWAVDHKPISRHDGRRGKDLFTTLVSLCRKWVPVKWKTGHNFWTSSITPDTAIVHFEDVSTKLSVDEEMKKTITGDLSIELKGANIVTRKFSDKPKFSASSQSFPLDYMDASIRGRIWLVEFTDYLQRHPPKQVLLYDDEDLTPFDNWMIQCVQCYFKNIDKLRGTPQLTDDQQEQALRASYGNRIFNTVGTVRVKIRRDGFIKTQDILEELEALNGDGKTIIRFKECYERMTGMWLVTVQRTINGERVRCYEAKRG